VCCYCFLVCRYYVLIFTRALFDLPLRLVKLIFNIFVLSFVLCLFCFFGVVNIVLLSMHRAYSPSKTPFEQERLSCSMGILLFCVVVVCLVLFIIVFFIIVLVSMHRTYSPSSMPCSFLFYFKKDLVCLLFSSKSLLEGKKRENASMSCSFFYKFSFRKFSSMPLEQERKIRCGVATIGRLLKIIGLLCKRAL